MNNLVHTIIFSNSFIISKALFDIVPEFFSRTEYIDKCDDFDILINKIEKQIYTIIFIDEFYFNKYKFFIDNIKGKTLIVPIFYNSDSACNMFKFAINILENKYQIHKSFAKLVEYVKTKIQEPTLDKELSNREKIILQMIAQGLTSKQIGDKLGISYQTVSSHRKNISAKLEIKTVSGLTVYAILNNLISIDEANLT
ncbi:MAG TPA: LuxR C-terminal-related transcriptional regulator [Candidatus Kapabacteria bacterium]|nr:LuxR C-terminal-related transcriptional regulator [Candidatus Kapabacteria bacterium]